MAATREESAFLAGRTWPSPRGVCLRAATAISARRWRFLMASRPRLMALQTSRDLTTRSRSSGRTLSSGGFVI
ncbi:hypothetical protein GYH30_057253 [Glycine max]|nr:hypothetical protein GYH30_057253 [Glycine max]